MNNWKAQETSSIEVDIYGSRKASMVVTMLQSRMITIDVHVVSFISKEKKRKIRLPIAPIAWENYNIFAIFKHYGTWK